MLEISTTNQWVVLILLIPFIPTSNVYHIEHRLWRLSVRMQCKGCSEIKNSIVVIQREGAEEFFQFLKSSADLRGDRIHGLSFVRSVAHTFRRQICSLLRGNLLWCRPSAWLCMALVYGWEGNAIAVAPKCLSADFPVFQCQEAGTLPLAGKYYPTLQKLFTNAFPPCAYFWLHFRRYCKCVDKTDKAQRTNNPLGINA